MDFEISKLDQTKFQNLNELTKWFRSGLQFHRADSERGLKQMILKVSRRGRRSFPVMRWIGIINQCFVNVLRRSSTCVINVQQCTEAVVYIICYVHQWLCPYAVTNIIHKWMLRAFTCITSIL